MNAAEVLLDLLDFEGETAWVNSTSIQWDPPKVILGIVSTPRDGSDRAVSRQKKNMSEHPEVKVKNYRTYMGGAPVSGLGEKAI